MYLIITIIELVFLCSGALFLVRSLSPIHRLIDELPTGNLKKRWNLLSNLILYFFLFYIAFGYSLWMSRESITLLAIIGSTLMLLGGGFAYLVGQLALQTTKDVKDLAILQQESITDALTGLKNRRYFNQRIMEEVALSNRYKLPLSLILISNIITLKRKNVRNLCQVPHARVQIYLILIQIFTKDFIIFSVCFNVSKTCIEHIQ